MVCERTAEDQPEPTADDRVWRVLHVLIVAS
jgi:hypothetical protein